MLKQCVTLLFSSVVLLGEVGSYFRITVRVIIVKQIGIMRTLKFECMADEICKM